MVVIGLIVRWVKVNWTVMEQPRRKRQSSAGFLFRCAVGKRLRMFPHGHLSAICIWRSPWCGPHRWPVTDLCSPTSTARQHSTLVAHICIRLATLTIRVLIHSTHLFWFLIAAFRNVISFLFLFFFLSVPFAMLQRLILAVSWWTGEAEPIECVINFHRFSIV